MDCLLLACLPNETVEEDANLRMVVLLLLEKGYQAKNRDGCMGEIRIRIISAAGFATQKPERSPTCLLNCTTLYIF